MKFRKNSKIRVVWTDFYQNITNSRMDEIQNQVVQYAATQGLKDFPKRNVEVIKKYIQIAPNTHLSDVNASSAVLDTVLDPKKLQNSYITYLNEHYPNFDAAKFFEIDEEVTDVLPDMESFDTRDRRYKVLYIKGENIFSFAEFHRDFSKSKGVNIIHSNPQNQGGKSALSRMVSFLLYGNKIKYVTSNVTFANIFNKYTTSNKAFIEGEVEIGSDIYFLRRTLTKDRNKIKHKFDIFVYDDINGLEKYGLRRPAVKFTFKDSNATSKKFQKTIGSYDDYVFASYYEYHNVEKWVQTTKTKRYRLFCEYLGLALLEAKYQAAKGMLTAHLKSSMLSKHSITELTETITELNNSLTELKITQIASEKKLTAIEENAKEISKEIANLYNKKHAIDSKFESYSVEESEKLIVKYKTELEAQETLITSLNESIAKFDESFSDLTQEELVKSELLEIESEYKAITYDVEMNDSLKEMQIKLSEVQLPKTATVKATKTQEKFNEYKVQGMGLAAEITLLKTTLEDTPDEISCKACGNVEDTTITKLDLAKNISDKETELSVVKEFAQKAHKDVKTVNSENENHLKELRANVSKEIETYRQDMLLEMESRKCKVQLKKEAKNSILNNFTEVRNFKNRLEVAQGKYTNIETNISYKEREITEFLANKGNIQENILITEEITVLKAQSEALKVEKTILQTTISTQTKDINISEYKVQENKDLIEELRHDAAIEKSLKIYLQVHGDDGLSKHIILSILPSINADLQLLLNGICDFDLSIRFDEKQIEFVLTKGGVEQQLFESSGLEKTMSCLALHYVNCRMTTLPVSNNLILDEILGRVAESNFKNVIPIIKRLCEVFDTVDLITHTHGEALKELVDNEIVVIKTNHISQIKK